LPRLSIQCVAARRLQLEQTTITPSMRGRRTRKNINHKNGWPGSVMSNLLLSILDIMQRVNLM
jgi:hypothetical protein